MNPAMRALRVLVATALKLLYKVEVRGLEHYAAAGKRVLIVANHTSFLDGVLLSAFLPDTLTYVVNTQIAKRSIFQPFLKLVPIFRADPTSPLSTKSLIRYLREDRKAVIFPEGRITVTGALMKIYDGPGMVADRSGAMILPIRIDGAQYTPFSRLRGVVRLRWFPPIRVTLLPPRQIVPPPELRGRERRRYAGKALSDLMSEMVFGTSHYRQTLFQALLDAQRVHGRGHPVLEDTRREILCYAQLTARSFLLGKRLAQATGTRERVGVLLPTTSDTLCAFMGLQVHARIAVMLNYTLAPEELSNCCRRTGLRTLLTSRLFVRMLRMGEWLRGAKQEMNVLYLEDLGRDVSIPERMHAWLAARFGQITYKHYCEHADADDAAVILFTNGTEGPPKPVVLSHANLLANRAQLVTAIDFNSHDVILSALPLFHAFGLTAGALLPLLSGMKTFFYPSPLHYRIVPEISYAINATILFGTDGFLRGYAEQAHPYDFYSIRYVFSGVDRVRAQTRTLWAEKFGLRIFESYGTTETSPLLAASTPMNYRPGHVGTLLPGIEARLLPVEGIEQAQRLLVRGPNIMLGYWDQEMQQIVAPMAEGMSGWFDTGDLVSRDDEGRIRWLDRISRTLCVDAELISLEQVESEAERLWPGFRHFALDVPDSNGRPHLLLLSEYPQANRQRLADELGKRERRNLLPERVLPIENLPLRASGAVDVAAALLLARAADA